MNIYEKDAALLSFQNLLHAELRPLITTGDFNNDAVRQFSDRLNQLEKLPSDAEALHHLREIIPILDELTGYKTHLRLEISADQIKNNTDRAIKAITTLKSYLPENLKLQKNTAHAD